MAKKMKTMDGNTAAAYCSYAFTEVAGIYPITPSSPMAECIDEWSASGKKNIFGETVDVIELQSEAGAAGAVHGSLSSGALTSTYTASQGLLLMIPNMYKIAGELLPGVFHVSARCLASHALNIFGDHTDVMAARQTGFAMLASNSVQEVMDLASVAHLSAIKGRIPFIHFFDGFRTSHEIQKIEEMPYEKLAEMVDYDAVQEFKNNALNPEHPTTKGTCQGPEIFFQAREASNKFYEAIPAIVADYMKEVSKITGRDYKPFNYYGAQDAEDIIVAMGSVCDTIEETIDYLNKNGEKVGLLKVHLYRPWAPEYMFEVLPKTVKRVAVLDRTKEPGAPGQPLYLDIKDSFYGKENAPLIVGGIYGLGSKDTTPSHIKAVYDNLKQANPKNDFTIGIVDDVTNKSLEVKEDIVTAPEGTISCKFWGLGSDGTVGANKSAIKIIGDNTDMYAQGYFAYDSKKSGGVTVSHLRFGEEPIKSTYLIADADFVSCSTQAYAESYDMVSDVKPGGIFLLNTVWNMDQLERHLPKEAKQYIANNNIRFYTINATKVAEEIGLGRRTNMIMQAAFFKLSEVIPYDEAEKLLKDSVRKTYGKKGDKIVNMNIAAIENGVSELVKIEVPESWKTADNEPKAKAERTDFVENVCDIMNAQKGDTLPVSAFDGYEDGTFPNGTAKYEKRGAAVNVPVWDANKCIQCNQCSYVCPHATIRPFLLDEEEKNNAPEGFETLEAKGPGVEGYNFRIQVSSYDCLGCGQCVEICPTNAISMTPIDDVLEEEGAHWDYAMSLSKKDVNVNKFTVKGSQFQTPLLEFSGACAGCVETPVAKLVTQLYGDRMYIANATGCSSIWGASAPTTPYTVNEKGQGPAWANSLFEDNAEFGYGMYLGVKKMRDTIAHKLENLVADDSVKADVKDAAKAWLDVKDKGEESKEASAKLVEALEACGCDNADAKYVLANKDQLVKKSFWMFGGDGWSYDIGYGGLDHVLASNEDVNVLVFDTEVYSNTGGQSSKATPAAAIAEFAASGKKTKKKDLGMMAKTYGYVYVAQVAIGADRNQLIKAIKEAEAYNGPSLIIAYSPCINHGINMTKAGEEAKKAVEVGYWHLYRYNPELLAEGKNPFILDSKEPKFDGFLDFIKGERRYASLAKAFPDKADALFEKNKEDAMERYAGYKKLAEQE
ncbi:pyruvate:ferredoxin (flavodoxin) oxidoreductase [Anaerofustis stercorihominis]|uniref:pyruvate:ferredoxin (flavodoxin) oxidoreductase n=1 Tax=Anaerofustis stercorihominis TaxID=214853 RepID=UPI00214C504C|nr:pyruvate:ferredoxin (flavodoxin) oxidoreductase [Anaerofustis stercorihominis]MCR2033750.1 pyruvate:ferredoxin (flavodoxin) oxidoreductase [Anaerofustis stercorihominis]